MHVLVTGTEGYLGCLLVPVLEAQGHHVTGVDAGYYRQGWLYHGLPGTPATRFVDVRELTSDHLVGIDAVVHMAELSNDPTGARFPDVTYAINHGASVRLASLAKAAGAERFVYMSSCSVYGRACDVVDEDTPVDPQTAYAHCKVLVERDVAAMAGDDFSPTFLRNATAFGASPRMRFDIVLNNLAGWAHTTREVRMWSDGSPWRPLVHAQDIATAIAATLESPREHVHATTFNVGADHLNYQVRTIAEIVAETFPGCRLSYGPASGDGRSYRVSFTRIGHVLPTFRCAWDAVSGARQLRGVFERIGLDAESFAAAPFTRLEQLERLIATGQLDDDLFWKPVAQEPGSGFRDAVA